MATVDVNLPHHQYEVRIEPGLLSRLGEQVRRLRPHKRAAVLCDAQVADTHAARAADSLSTAGYDVLKQPLPHGEAHKTLATVEKAYHLLVDHHFERKSPIVAVGGGVTGDTAGFVAASYLRGVPFIQCPTTLLAMVDASVGGKVGVNLPQGKNLVGAFYQPALVAIDTDTLATLPERERRCGLAECVKHGVIRDAALFDWIDQNLARIQALESDAMVELVARNVAIKAAVVVADEKEAGERAHLNFGHTFAHAIEAISGYGHYHHGEAVSLGMVAAARLAAEAGRCDAALVDRLVNLLDRIGLPTSAPDLAPTDKLIDAMKLDKKVEAGAIRLVLPDRMGAVSIVSDTPEAAVRSAWDSLR